MKQEDIFTKGKIQDVVVYPLRKFVDERGWLCELFRHDEIAEEFYPAMAYISITEPLVQRGPHEHADQADLFCFIGTGNFKLRLWDNRAASPTYRNVMTLFVGADNPNAVIIPKGVAHAYKNVSATEKGVVINCPNRLFMGENKREPIDEIRHEDDPHTIFQSKIVPPEVLYRKKMGFGVPLTHWFRGDLKDFVRDVLLSDKSMKRGIVKPEMLEKYVGEHLDAKRDYTFQIWTLLMLELWFQRFID